MSNTPPPVPYEPRRVVSTNWPAILIAIGGLAAVAAIGVTLAVGVFVGSAANQVVQTEPVPVVVSFRSSAMENSFVAQVRNGSGQLLRNMTVHIESADGSRSKDYKLREFTAGQVIEIGWKEGFRVYPGDNVIVSADRYRPLGTTLSHP